MKSKRIYITGISGTGKSAVVAELLRRGVFAFSIEDGEENLCSWVNMKTGKVVHDYPENMEWLRSHDWRLDIEKLKKVLEREKARDVIITTGVTGNQDEYLDLFDQILLLRCNKETAMKRIETRYLHGGNNFGKHAYEREYALEIFDSFNQKMLDRGAIPINAEQPLKKVVDEIVLKINTL